MAHWLCMFARCCDALGQQAQLTAADSAQRGTGTELAICGPSVGWYAINFLMLWLAWSYWFFQVERWRRIRLTGEAGRGQT
eukprot:364579-Chlamydomonas_euryale.AAC.7